MSGNLRALLQKIGGGATWGEQRNLTGDEAALAWRTMLEGGASEVLMAAFFAAMRAKGSTADELDGCARVARGRLRFPDLPEDAVVLATSRLGKFHSPPLGLAAAATAAACGVPVLIQAARQARGSGVTLGDLWESMVGPLRSDPARVEAELARHRLSCWSVTAADPAWETLLEVEEALGMRCMPDIVVKLVVPPGCRLLLAAMPGPVLGVAGDAILGLGHRDALIVQGIESSMDPSVCGRTRGLQIESGAIYPLRLVPEDLALQCEEEPTFLGGDRLEGARNANLQALMGMAGPVRSAVILGASLFLVLSGRVPALADALAPVQEALDSGRAHQVLEEVAGGAQESPGRSG